MLISKLKALTKVILETDVGVLYQLVIIEPEHSIVTMTCGDPACRVDTPRRCKVLGSVAGQAIDPAVTPGRGLLVRFADVDAVIGPIVSGYVEGAGWHYDLWGQQ